MARRLSAVSVEALSFNLAGGLQVDRLPADHSDRAGCARDHAQRGQLSRDDERVLGDGLASHQRERLGLQGIARQDRDAVAVHGVKRGTPAAQAVVVHRRQIVVNERIGVDELHGAGGRQGQFECRRPRAPCHRVRRRNHQQRTQPLSPSQAGCSASRRRAAPDTPAAFGRKRSSAESTCARVSTRKVASVEERTSFIAVRARRRRANLAPASIRRAR